MSEGSRVRVPRWYGATVATVSLVLVGLLFGRPVFLVGAAAPLLYVGVSTLSAVEEVDLAVTRTVSNDRPIPGETVTVSLDLQNVGSRTLVDLRAVDGVPTGLAVVGGSPRACVGLRPGESHTLEYDVVAVRGDHAFSDPRLRARSLSASSIVTRSTPADGVEELRCELQLEAVFLHPETITYVGQVPTEVAGSGIEFYSTREYRPNDSLNRIDWRRYAETGELSTVQFREDQASVVVFVVDDRPVARRSTNTTEPTATELGLYAVERAITTLRRDGNQVGVTSPGSDAGFVSPGRGRAVEASFEQLATAVADGAGGADPPAGSTNRDPDPGELHRRLPEHAQVVLVSPVLDDYPLRLVDRLRTHGHAITVLSPDVTGTGTFGGRVEHLRRDLRLVELRERGAAIVDWDVTDPLSIAVAETIDRWIER